MPQLAIRRESICEQSRLDTALSVLHIIQLMLLTHLLLIERLNYLEEIVIVYTSLGREMFD